MRETVATVPTRNNGDSGGIRVSGSNSGRGVGLISNSGVVRGSVSVQGIRNDSLVIATEVTDFVRPIGAEIASPVFDINQVNENGEKIDLESDATICLDVEGNIKTEDTCLGYLDEESGVWKCEDECLEQSGDQLCGFPFYQFCYIV